MLDSLKIEPWQVVKAMNVARVAHQDQMYGNLPYAVHLLDVEKVLVRFGFTEPDLLSAAWLHDSIEDGHISRLQLEAEFGSGIMSLVWAVTDGEGSNRLERKAVSYAKMVQLPRAVIIKLADRIANLESALVNNRKLAQMYVAEHHALYDALFTVGGSDPRVLSMWQHLDHLVSH